MTTKCNVTDQFAVMQCLEMLKLSSPSTCLSVVLNLDVNKKKNSSRDWRRFVPYCHDSPRDGRWSVQVPCVSQLQSQSPLLPVRHASAWCCCGLLRGPSALHCGLTSSAFCFCVGVVVLVFFFFCSF